MEKDKIQQVVLAARKARQENLEVAEVHGDEVVSDTVEPDKDKKIPADSDE